MEIDMACSPRETMDQRTTRLHQAACRLGRKAYRDPVTRSRICTSVFLLGRGFCCGCACRHCPFPEADRHAASGGHEGLQANGQAAGVATGGDRV
jgi:hypothetical protein